MSWPAAGRERPGPPPGPHAATAGAALRCFRGRAPPGVRVAVAAGRSLERRRRASGAHEGLGVPADPETSFHGLEDRSRTDLAAGPSSGARTVSTANVRGY